MAADDDEGKGDMRTTKYRVFRQVPVEEGTPADMELWLSAGEYEATTRKRAIDEAVRLGKAGPNSRFATSSSADWQEIDAEEEIQTTLTFSPVNGEASDAV